MDIPRIHSASGPHQNQSTPLRHRTTAGDSQLHWRAIGDRATASRDGRSVGVQCRTLHAVDRDVSSSHAGYFADVASVRGDHRMVSADRPLDNRDVNDVVVTSPSRQCPDRPGLGLGEILDVAPLQQARQVRLWPAAPTLSEHTRGHCRGEPSPESSPVKRPHDPVIPFCGDQSSRVVGQAVGAHALRAGLRVPPETRRSRRISPAASSLGVRAPAASSHSATPRRPSRTRS